MCGSIVCDTLIAMLQYLIYPKAVILYYHHERLLIDRNLWNNFAMNQTMALKRLVRDRSSGAW